MSSHTLAAPTIHFVLLRYDTPLFGARPRISWQAVDAIFYVIFRAPTPPLVENTSFALYLNWVDLHKFVSRAHVLLMLRVRRKCTVESEINPVQTARAKEQTVFPKRRTPFAPTH